MTGSLIFFIIIIYVIKKSIDQSNAADKKKKVGNSQKKGSEPAKNPEKAGERQRVVQVVQAEKADGNSTTEYLRQKALEDEREHDKESKQEAMRLQKKAGGRMAAMRYIDGDSIPKGMHIVTCSYCGAQNLIADQKRDGECTCYFCREGL